MTGQSAAPAGLEQALAATEAGLAGLHAALLQHDAAAIERQADALQRTLAQAVTTFQAAARRGALVPALQQRLARAAAQVAGQRESLLRGNAALDRALATLLPTAGRGAALYSSTGVPQLRSSGPGLDA